jgi:integrase
MPGHHLGRPPRNKGRRYPADPPTVEEIVAVMRCAGPTIYGLRTRALIVLLWRAGLRISEALALAESDFDSATGSVLVRRGKAASVVKWAWTAGPGNRSNHGSTSARHSQSEPCSVSSTAPQPDGLGRRPPRERLSRTWP